MTFVPNVKPAHPRNTQWSNSDKPTVRRGPHVTKIHPISNSGHEKTDSETWLKLDNSHLKFLHNLVQNATNQDFKLIK